MLKKEQQRNSDSRRLHGIDAAGNALHGILYQGLALLLIPAVLLLAWLLVLRQPALERELVDEVAAGYAASRAQAIAAQTAAVQARLQSMLASDELTALLPAPAPETLAGAAADALAGFPDAVGLRVFALDDRGTAGLQEGEGGLVNHIEIDLVRRASNGEPTMPEAYRAGEQWLYSFAERGTLDGDGERLVALLSYDERLLRDSLAAPEDQGGTFSLLQRLQGRGAGAETRVFGPGPGERAARAAVAGTPWFVVFTPGEALVASLEAKVSQPLLALLLLLLAGSAGFALVARRYPALLRREVARAEAAAEHRTPYTLKVPELAPIARSLRKLTLRRTRMDGVPRVPEAAAPAPATVSSAPSREAVSGPAEALPAHIFRAYDIRGIADTELDDDTVYRIGAAIGTLADSLGEQTLLLGYDGRVSSGRIRAGLERALLQAGRDVIDIGLVPTPLAYFAAHQFEDATSALIVTGSHNPAEYNGVKLYLQRKPVASGDIERVREIALSGKFTQGSGHKLQRDVASDYLDELVGDVAIAMPLKIVVDAGNGATGHLAPTLFEELGCEVIPLYCDIDGSFPNHPPDTSVAANLADLQEAVRREGADFGVAFDGDGDRVAAVTGSGEIVAADYLLMLFAQDVITRNPGADVVYDVKCSRNLAQLVTSLGGRGVLWRTGHTHIKEKVAETGALVGGEFSGHMVFGERWFGFDDGLYAAARLAEIVSSSESSLDELLGQFHHSASTPEIIIPVDEAQKFQLVEAFRQQADFGDGRINDLDGVRVDYTRGWGLLRASNTSAALTARFEGDDETALQEIMTRFREQLAKVHPDLEPNF
ncbi:MAG TPA: phosphomannomutase/phosphoglucomutase [Halieaceae bacterium]|nr:phosphomannomutase/phosphoglucomutase [Halieaceae bacterium]